MSHVALIELEIKRDQVDCCKTAAKALGGELIEGESHYRWFGEFLNDSTTGRELVKMGMDPKQFGKNAEHIIRFPGCKYDIGLCEHPQKPGVLVPIFDQWAGGGGISQKCGGRELGKLKQAFAEAVTIKQAYEYGYTVEQEVLEDGTVQLRLMQ